MTTWETKEHIANENRIAATIADARGVQQEKLPPFSRCDRIFYRVTGGKRINLAVAEIKCRKDFPYFNWPTALVDWQKMVGLYEGAAMLDIPPILFLEFSTGIYFYVPKSLEELNGFHRAMGGRRILRDENDRKIVVYIPMEKFSKLLLGAQ